MSYSFHPEAENEFFEAIEYYEVREGGLGFDFSVEVFSGIKTIVENPPLWPVLEADVRRFLIHRFPFGLLYSIEPDGVFILAVMHLKRDPDYWKERK